MLAAALGLDRLPHTWLEECRQPVFTFSWGNDATASYGFYVLSLPTWIELLTLCVMHMLVAALTAVPIYYTVLRPALRLRQLQDGKKDQNKPIDSTPSSTMPLLLTLGVFLPFWILAPKATMEYFGLKNQLFLFCLCVITPTTSIFRLCEASFGFTPTHATRSVSDFMLYYASPLLLKHDHQTGYYVKTTPRVIFRHLTIFLFHLFITGMYQSLFFVHPAFPKLGVVTANPDEYYAIRRVLDPSVWLQTALYAVLLQQYLTAMGEGLMFSTNILTGLQTEKLMDNPMFESSSPSDFWGRRWNLLIHKCLKGGIYKPVRSLGGSQAMAVFASFVASGLFHEWIVPCVFFEYPHNVAGRQLVFFAWQGMLVAVEAAIGYTHLIQTLQKHLPKPVRSFLVILCGIPFGHWFLDAYVNSDFFTQGNMVFFGILPVDQQ